MLFLLRLINISIDNKDTGTYGCISRLRGIPCIIEYCTNFLPDKMNDSHCDFFYCNSLIKNSQLYQVLFIKCREL